MSDWMDQIINFHDDLLYFTDKKYYPKCKFSNKMSIYRNLGCQRIC